MVHGIALAQLAEEVRGVQHQRLVGSLRRVRQATDVVHHSVAVANGGRRLDQCYEPRHEERSLAAGDVLLRLHLSGDVQIQQRLPLASDGHRELAVVALAMDQRFRAAEGPDALLPLSEQVLEPVTDALRQQGQRGNELQLCLLAQVRLKPHLGEEVRVGAVAPDIRQFLEAAEGAHLHLHALAVHAPPRLRHRLRRHPLAVAEDLAEEDLAATQMLVRQGAVRPQIEVHRPLPLDFLPEPFVVNRRSLVNDLGELQLEDQLLVVGRRDVVGTHARFPGYAVERRLDPCVDLLRGARVGGHNPIHLANLNEQVPLGVLDLDLHVVQLPVPRLVLGGKLTLHIAHAMLVRVVSARPAVHPRRRQEIRLEVAIVDGAVEGHMRDRVQHPLAVRAPRALREPCPTWRLVRVDPHLRARNVQVRTSAAEVEPSDGIREHEVPPGRGVGHGAEGLRSRPILPVARHHDLDLVLRRFIVMLKGRLALRLQQAQHLVEVAVVRDTKGRQCELEVVDLLEEQAERDPRTHFPVAKPIHLHALDLVADRPLGEGQQGLLVVRVELVHEDRRVVPHLDAQGLLLEVHV
mmetsp:Transcript_129129/g.373777  ORF Transcript_129129/g.373777 Transcript_129129/m.373777 type:complete len:578 (+) Transcript_129129:1190-2923(+)